MIIPLSYFIIGIVWNHKKTRLFVQQGVQSISRNTNVIYHRTFVRGIHRSPLDSLQWRHNGPDSVSNHQPHHCLLNRFFGRRSKKTSQLCVTGLCAGNSPGTGEFPAQKAGNAENVSIWWRHHVFSQRAMYTDSVSMLWRHHAPNVALIIISSLLFNAVWSYAYQQNNICKQKTTLLCYQWFMANSLKKKMDVSCNSGLCGSDYHRSIHQYNCDLINWFSAVNAVCAFEALLNRNRSMKIDSLWPNDVI